MCTQLFNMKHTQHKQSTHTHRHTHTHARIQTAYWSRVRRREVVGGPIRTRRQTHCCSSKSRACQATTYPCPCAFDLCSPHPPSPLSHSTNVSFCMRIHICSLYLCIVTALPSCRGESERAPSYSRLIFVCKQFPFVIFKFTLWSTFFFCF